jgi:hypothetical protein
MKFKNFWSKPLEQRGWTTTQQKTSLKHSLSKQVELKVQRWEKWCIELLRPAGTTPVADVGRISHSMETRIITLQLLIPIECALSVTRVTQQHPDRNGVFSMQMKR